MVSLWNFIKKLWDTIKSDLMSMFQDLHSRELPIFNLNFGFISLIPKAQEVNRIQQYRPICLLNVSYKIFTKVTTNIFNQVPEHIISPSQTVFMRGRNTLEGVVIRHESIHELHKKTKWSYPKIDFEKAYDKVKLPFLFQSLKMKCFSAKWISWIKSFIKGSSVRVNVDDDVGHFFQTRNVLRQGNPLSPILFNIVIDMLAVLIKRTEDEGQISGIIPHLVDDGILFLQYADDTIIFMDHDLDKSQNMKLLLYAFEQVLWMKINFHKSKLFCFGEAQDVADQYAKMFGCVSGKFPLKYLGILIHFRKLSNVD
jgi:hypothetical protein